MQYSAIIIVKYRLNNPKTIIMKAQKLIFAVAVLFTIGLSTSCTKEDVVDDQTEINAIDGNEIKDEDM